MRAETVLFLPRANGYRITDEFRQRTYGTITVETVAPNPAARPTPARPGRVTAAQRFHLAIDLGGGIAIQEAFVDLVEAQERAEAFLRAQGALG